MREAGFSGVTSARRDLDEHVRLGRLETFECARPMTDAWVLRDGSLLRGESKQGGNVEAARSVDEAVSGVGYAHDPRNEAVPARKRRRVRLECADEPPADGAETEDTDAHVLQARGFFAMKTTKSSSLVGDRSS